MDYKPTYLYIKRHKKTGLYYFGKTIKNPLSYTGSGVYWSSHLKKHGNDVETIWHQLFTNKEELKKVACVHCKKISTPGNIVRWHNDNCKERLL